MKTAETLPENIQENAVTVFLTDLAYFIIEHYL